MIQPCIIGVEPLYEKRRLQRLTQQELQTLAVSKDSFDHDFPEHSKFITRSDFWRIAREKTLQKLCLPLGDNEKQEGSTMNTVSG